MSDAIFVRGSCEDNRVVVAAAVAAGEIRQLANGRAGVYTGLNAAAAGDNSNFTMEGKFTVTKTASQVWIDGAPIWWDHSANAATCIMPLVAGDRDFFLGAAVGDASSAATTGVVDLNVEPRYIIDSTRDPFDTVVVKTVVGSATVEVPDAKARGGAIEMNFGTTAEAQKVDAMSKRSFALASNWIMEGVINIITNGDAAAVDINIGVANGTHATDFEAIGEFVSLQFDGASLNINASSDDGTTDVTITDTTVDFVAGTPIFFAIDGRNPDDVQIYVNGVLMLGSTVFTLAAATGPLKAIAHMEKTSDDSPGTVQVTMRVRTAEQ